MGAVERVLVLGIVVVIVAILGIAVWGAAGDDSGKAVVAADGGAVVTVPDAPAASDSVAGGAPAPLSGIEAWRQLREQEQASRGAELAANATPGAPGTAATPGVLPNAIGATPLLKNAVALEGTVNVQPVSTVPGALETGTPTVIDPAHAAPVKTAKDAKDTKESGAANTYTVVSGDSLWKIAHRNYGDADIQGHIDSILAANPKVNPDNLKVGTRLTLPGKVTTDVSRLPAKQQVAAHGDGTLYDVASGDTLTSIAKRKLGDGGRWKEIYELNRERIADPAKINVGTSLRLPPKN